MEVTLLCKIWLRHQFLTIIQLDKSKESYGDIQSYIQLETIETRTKNVTLYIYILVGFFFVYFSFVYLHSASLSIQGRRSCQPTLVRLWGSNIEDESIFDKNQNNPTL